MSLPKSSERRISLNNRVHLYELSEAMTAVLENGGEISFVTAGYSMLPLLRNREDKVFLKKIQKKPRKGDVIFYRRENGAYVLHRIIGQNADGYILRGDNQSDIEYGVRDDMILASLRKVVRSDGRIIESDSRRNRLYVLLLPLIRLSRLKIYPVYAKAVKKIIKK